MPPHIPLTAFRSEANRSTTRFCEAAGCIQTTREGKPYCSDHVEMHPYVQSLLNGMAERDDEEDRVRRKGHRAKVDMDGLNVQTILLTLKTQGSRTVERLVRETQIDVKALDAYIAILTKRGIVKQGRTNRGSTVVSLCNAKAALDGAQLVEPPEADAKESA